MAIAVEALVQVLRKTGRMDEADNLEAQAKEHEFKMFD